MKKEDFIEWLKKHDYALGVASSGHLGRKDAWTKKLPGAWPTTTIRYFVAGKMVQKESSLGFGAFHLEWKAPLGSLSVTEEGKLKRL